MTTIGRGWLAVFLSATCFLLACRDTIQASYASRADAEKSGAVAHGWVPTVVPEGSTEIREAHNVDTNQTWGRFVVSASGTEALQVALTEIAVSSLAGQEVRPPNVSWWPPVLTGRLGELELRATGFRFYKTQQNGTVFFAINGQKNEAFFWRPGPYQQ
jgi:hypothetical protein